MKNIKGKIGLFIACWLTISFGVTAQTISINEVAPTNVSFQDEDGETKDWIEFYNNTDATISIENWSITDDISDPQKWIFPELEIESKGFFTIFASGKDRNTPLTYRNFIQLGDNAKYIVPNSATSTTWRMLGFDDSNWKDGATGIGYGDGDDATIVPSGIRSVFLRQTFMVTDPNQIKEILLHIDYDDAFVAYINGKEIARANIESGAFPPYYVGATTDREAKFYQGEGLQKYKLSELENLLVAGENILAIQVHNINSNSSDLTIIPFLTLGGEGLTGGNDLPEALNLAASFYHTNFKLSNSETIYLFDANNELQDSLAIPLLPSGVSVGRFPDGATNNFIFEQTTPNAPNAGTYFEGTIDGTVLFSKNSGIYEEGFVLTLSTEATGTTIRYTTDGSIPNSTSSIYQNPIPIQLNTTIQAAIFKDNFLPSEKTSNTYLININHDLPVLSVAFKNEDFFSESIGMYSFGTDYEEDFPHFGANFWKDLEKPVQLTFFENEKIGFNTGAGAKVFGGWSRGNAQRSLSLFFRSQYGDSRLKYPIFEERAYDKYEALVLRNSGNDWQRTMLRDLTLTGLMQHSNVDIQAGKPIVTYLNGEYWGIYNVREKVNEHYLASLHNVPAEDITILEKESVVIFGDNQDYLSLLNYINNNSLIVTSNYEKVEAEVDIDNFIQYNVAQIYFDNTDWPGNNIKFWRHKNGKWRWILFDTDFGFGIWNVEQYSNNTLAFALNPSGPGWPNPPWSTFMFRKLMENEAFQKQFVNTFADELNTRFLAPKVKAAIEANEAIVSNEMPRHIDKWGETSMSAWRSKVNDMKTFASQRPVFMRAHIKNELNLPFHKQVNLKIDKPEGGSIQLNTIRVTDASWSGFYFPTVPITLTAVAKPGYRFSHWSGAVDSENITIAIDPNRIINLTANFTAQTSTADQSDVLFNEINYNSNEAAVVGDWIELYNNGSSQDLTDWQFKDDDDEHVFQFPVGTILEADAYLVVTRDSEKFTARFPNVANYLGNFDFGLSSKGEFLRLFDSEGALVDSVFYLPDSGWPEAADGAGPSLELVDPNSDNTLPENWTTFTSNGTPGRANGIYTSTNTISPLAEFITIHPNPIEEQLTIQIDLPKRSDVQIDLLSINGQVLQNLAQQKGVKEQQFELTMPTMTSGNYLIRVIVDGEQLVKKVVKL